jgi:TPR repeat protein
MKNLLLALTLLSFAGCAHHAKEPLAPVPVETAPAEAPPSRAALLHAEGVELLYSKDPKVKDARKAYLKFKEAAELGDAPSMDLLGGFYAIGVAGVKKDCSEAMNWYEKASEAGYPLAFNNLAYMLVTCENNKLRDADRAESIMKFLFQSQPNIVALLDTYATVLSEQKDFKQAAKTMEVVIDLQKFIDDNPERIDQAQKTLDLFRHRKPIDALRASLKSSKSNN